MFLLFDKNTNLRAMTEIKRDMVLKNRCREARLYCL